jgi:hypothetical protein
LVRAGGTVLRAEENRGADFPHCAGYFLQIEWITACLRWVFGESKAKMEVALTPDFLEVRLFVFN